MKQLLLTLLFILSSIYSHAQIVAYPSVNDSYVLGTSCADLRYVDPVVIGHQLNVSVAYYESLEDAQNEVNPLNRFYETIGDPPQIIFARVDSTLDSSFDIAESTLTWIVNDCNPCPPPPGISPVYLEVCDVDMEGIAVVHLDNLRALYYGYAFPTATFCASEDNEVSTTYYLTESDAINETNPVGPVYSFSGSQTFFRKLKNVTTNEFLIDDLITVTVVSCSTDTDMDGIADLAEDANRNLLTDDDDTDQDGLKNFEDADDDGDGILTIDEDYNGNGDPTDDDVNGNGVADYLEASVTLNLADVNDFEFSIYPNPVSGVLYIEMANTLPVDGVAIFDVLGTKVMSLNTVNASIDVSGLSSGLYILKVAKNGYFLTQKFVKK